MSKEEVINIFGDQIEACCHDPVTGYFRDGFCNTDEHDFGSHVVCAEITEDFLTFSKAKGNDLSTPRPEFNFPGLKEGDSWCICAGTYAEAIKAGTACKVFLKKTNYKTLEIIPLEKLKKYAVDLS